MTADGFGLLRGLAMPARWAAAGLRTASSLLGGLLAPSTDSTERPHAGARATALPGDAAVSFAEEPMHPITGPGRAGRRDGLEASKPAASARTPLPPAAAQDRLIALARTPETAFAFWTVSSESAERLRLVPRLALRVCGTGSAPDATAAERMIPLLPDARTAYVCGLEPGDEVEIRLGRIEDDCFVPLATARPIRMPPRTPDVRGPTIWRDHESGRVVPGYEAIAGEGLAPAPLPRLPPTAPPSHGDVGPDAPNPRAIPPDR